MNKKIFFGIACGILLPVMSISGGDGLPQQVTCEHDIATLTENGFCVGKMTLSLPGDDTSGLQTRANNLLNKGHSLWICCKDPYNKRKADQWYTFSGEDLSLLTNSVVEDFKTVTLVCCTKK